MTLCFISRNLRAELPKDCILPSKDAQMIVKASTNDNRDAQWSFEREFVFFLYQVRTLVSEIEPVTDNLREKTSKSLGKNISVYNTLCFVFFFFLRNI